MSNCLKIGGRLLDSDQMISALVQYKLLEPLVGHLLLDEVFKEVPLLKQEVFHTLTGGADDAIPDNFEQFVAQWCQQRDITLEYFQTVMIREWQLQKFKQIQFATQVESEFLRMKPDLDQVEYSLIQLEDSSLAQELYFQLRDDGIAFSKLAREHSLGDEKQSEGWVGPVPFSTLPIDIAALFRHQRAGVVYPPVRIGDRCWIVRLERLIAARLTHATRTQVIERLYNRWLQTQIQQVMNTPGAIAVQSEQTLAIA
ncbi:peptidylprolyl isomerase [Leptolyngbya sp. AN03gr2]|uniref:peptidylprolyl isomerase n=1 Tax=unclassified Leptolyngbya TaxID=2650499 RepID=UPI003D312385